MLAELRWPLRYASRVPTDLILRESVDGVMTLTMNNPSRLNGWTMDMIKALKAALLDAASDSAIGAVVLTGTGKYYCAGVNLGASLQVDHPRRLHAFIVENNQALFDAFLDFPKPILVAVNGPAIGACVTSATLCNAVLASEDATFSTPFSALGVPPEGCSSEVFPPLLGDAAERMLGPEGWKPTGNEAVEVGLATRCVPADTLMVEAQRMARAWVESGELRRYPLEMSRDELKAINARESKVLASAFLKLPFLMGQFRFLWSKKKRPLAMTFLALAATQPAWRYLLPAEAR